MLVIVPVGAVLFNCIVFGLAFFTDLKRFLGATLLAMVAIGAYFALCGGVAVLLKGRFPSEEAVGKRLSLMILTFLVMSGLFLYALLHLYEKIPMLRYHFEERGFAWAYFGMGVCNVFLTFLMEGIARYQAWETSWQETDQLYQAFKKSQLAGLKSQVNPHFLFNSLNSLSSLIQEDEAKAEQFLDEMSKVYRYMLRDDAQWVTLETEIKFTKSYLHLLDVRFGEALHVSWDIAERALQRGIAPLSLQVVIENAFSQNVMRKAHPLSIEVHTDAAGNLLIRHNIQRKVNASLTDTENGLDHLVAKYKLFQHPVQVKDDSETSMRTIAIPLVDIEP